MKDISKFINSLNTSEFEEDALFALDDLPITEKQKKMLGAMGFGMALKMIEKYHKWVNSDSDETKPS